ncbi:hypothetical protein [Pseudomonas sp. RIT-PI-AD]|uniref:hypothetical protein n=1 Tax=Pseudomonas sp. RIT-PI-AD TaxID=3035294 RepID=UPI0021DA89D4|nr:hypothetical protein [Pseudomonas sp. RIT-PI-AD]
MTLLRALFTPAAPLRHYALLDGRGRCRAIHSARRAPSGHGWVEVVESRLSWLGQPLPAEARLIRHTAPAISRSALAA